jgi:hypothetical protein
MRRPAKFCANPPQEAKSSFSGEKLIARSALFSLIGDATSDIVTERANGIRAISVRTGITPVEELVRERPDVLLRDRRELGLRMLETGLPLR